MQLSKVEKKIVVNILKNYIENGEVRVFGSRYKGTGDIYSNLDLVIVGESKLSLSEMGNLKYEFKESDLLFQVDI